MTRRTFQKVLVAGAVASGGPIHLQAIAAPTLPATLAIQPELLPTAIHIVERRTYAHTEPRAQASGLTQYPGQALKPLACARGSVSGADHMANLFREHRIHVLRAHHDFLLGFESLSAREKAWRELSSDPKWIASRAELTELAIYEVPQPGSKIFDRSL